MISTTWSCDNCGNSLVVDSFPMHWTQVIQGSVMYITCKNDCLVALSWKLRHNKPLGTQVKVEGMVVDG